MCLFSDEIHVDTYSCFPYLVTESLNEEVGNGNDNDVDDINEDNNVDNNEDVNNINVSDSDTAKNQYESDEGNAFDCFHADD